MSTRNRCLNEIRRILAEEKAEKSLTLNYVSFHNKTEESILLNDTKRQIDRVIDLLPHKQKEDYLLCHQEGLKYVEVAERLNISVKTVETHMSRALKFLRTNLKNNPDVLAILILLKIY